MLSFDIPGFGKLELEHLVVDYNGTVAQDGTLLPGVAEMIRALAASLRVHVITADTFGLARAQLAGLPQALTVIPAEGQAEAKLAYVSKLGTASVVAIGNGRNDWKMLSAVALGVAVVQREGAAAEALASADVISTNVVDALELLNNPKRLIATLRS